MISGDNQDTSDEFSCGGLLSDDSSSDTSSSDSEDDGGGGGGGSGGGSARHRDGGGRHHRDHGGPSQVTGAAYRKPSFPTDSRFSYLLYVLLLISVTDPAPTASYEPSNVNGDLRRGRGRGETRNP